MFSKRISKQLIKASTVALVWNCYITMILGFGVLLVFAIAAIIASLNEVINYINKKRNEK